MRLPGITYDSRRKFSLGQRVQLATLPYVFSGAMWAIFRNCRFEFRGMENVDQTIQLDGHALIAIWHESMLMACWINQGKNYHTLTSHSFDGELAARTVRRFGIEAVRGSSSQGGAEALRQLQLAAQQVPRVGFTLDGPRGPRRVAKSGIAILAGRTRLSVVPLAIVPLRATRLGSWDRLPIPHPFSRVIAAFGEPIPPPPSENDDDVEQTRLAVQQGLNRLYGQLEAEFNLSP